MTGLATGRRLPAWVEGDLRAAIAVANKGKAHTDGALWEYLYVHWYQRPSSVEAKARRAQPHTISMVECFRAAHADTFRFEEGWCVVEPAPGWQARGIGHVVVENGSETRILVPVDYVSERRVAQLPRAGDPLLATARRDTVGGGFWTTHSRAWLDVPLVTPIARLYWNVGAEGAIALIRHWTSCFSGHDEPYMIKAPAVANAYGRADGVVVYLPADRARELGSSLHRVHESLAEWLDAPTPRLARPLATGLAAAIDPGRDQSFGEHRCRLIADALADGSNDPLEDVIRRFRVAGLRPEAPHLSPGLSWDIDW